MESTPTPSSSTAETSSRQEERSLFANFRLVSLMTFLSRILGLVRDMGMAMLFGNGPIMDAFSIAFRVPNLARRLFGEGALSTAFLPAFIHEREQQGLTSAWRLATATLVWLAQFLCAVVLAGLLFLVALYAAGFDSAEYQLLFGLTAVMLPYLVLICLVAQISAVMHAHNSFGWPAFSPLILNGLWIIAIWGVAPWCASPESQVYVMAVTILIAGGVQLVSLFGPLQRLGYRYASDWRDARSQVRDVIRGMMPVLIGLSIAQINSVSDSLIAWGFSAPVEIIEPGDGLLIASWNLAYPLEPGTASALYFGQRLLQFPLGLFGLALGTVLFPLMTRHAAAQRIDRMQRTLLLGLKQVIGVGLPASAGMIILAGPITRLLFEYGQFTSDDSVQTSQMIAAYGAAVWSSCALLILHRGFYALGDRLTPLYVGLQMVVLNLILNFSLIWIWEGVGLAISTAICAAVQVVLVIHKFERQIGRLDRGELGKTILQTTLAVTAMSVVCGGLLFLLPEAVSFIGRLRNVVVPMVAAIGVYFLAAWWFKMDFLWALFRRRGMEQLNSDEDDLKAE